MDIANVFRGNRRRMAGVTLLELMIVVVVVSLLATIAIPSYRQYAIRAQRTEAKSALLQLAANQERYYTSNGNTFVNDLARINMPATTEGNRYALAVTHADTTSFTATATAINGMTDDDECQVFQIDSEGRRSASPDPRGTCW
ncbi:MAG TPA: type IV pilin protein [Gammaproteobacteria bacterium]